MNYTNWSNERLLALLQESRRNRKQQEKMEKEIRQEINKRTGITEPERYPKKHSMLSTHQIKEILKLTNPETTRKIIDLIEQ